MTLLLIYNTNTHCLKTAIGNHFLTGFIADVYILEPQKTAVFLLFFWLKKIQFVFRGNGNKRLSVLIALSLQLESYLLFGQRGHPLNEVAS